MVGRSEELALIAEAVTTSDDSARGIVLSGAAGVGKTRVAREAVARSGGRNVRRQWIVGTASGRSVPLGAFADIATDFGPDPLRRVREVIDALVSGSHPHDVVVGVDDAHLLDDLSAFAIHQIVTRRLATVILTIRSATEPPPDAIAAIWKENLLQRLELQPLSLAETTGLIEHVLNGHVHSFSAQRLWQFTNGNTLYLRHLLDSEVNAGRLALVADMWLWEGQPELSPTLAELVDAQIARAPRPVRDVLDALAIAEPLDVDILTAVTDADAPAEAEALGLVSVDSGRPASVRLAHPMFGEVRRIGSLRLRQLAGRIARELGGRDASDPRQLVRRAILTIRSDLEPDAELFLAAAAAATQLMDVKLALTLAERAEAAGGGTDAKLAQAMANFWLERPTSAEAILCGLAAQTSGPTRAQVAAVRISNLAGELGEPARAAQELDDALPNGDPESDAVADAFRALIDVVRGRSAVAVERANGVLALPPDTDFAHMHAIFVVVSGLGDLGRFDGIEAVADKGYELADRSAAVSHARFQLAFLQSNAYRFGGALGQADAAIARIRRETLDVPFEESWHRLLAGMSAMSRGSVADARRLLRESVACAGIGGRMVKTFAQSWLSTVTAMSGRAADARREFDAIAWWAQDPEACVWDPERSIAEAWTSAAEGAVSQAISIMRDAAERESERGRPGWEVVLLQTATQFGDAGTAARLSELADVVQGPRASAAAAHAVALASGSGDALVNASHQYEQFGDRLAAADAAAHAVVAYQRAGLRGAALSASASARRLGDECQSPQTPALRDATMPQPFTARQTEIISLAAQGFSNQQIAERLTMSIRSIEGHLFRASQRVGANSRDQLIAILRGA